MQTLAAQHRVVSYREAQPWDQTFLNTYRQSPQSELTTRRRFGAFLLLVFLLLLLIPARAKAQSLEPAQIYLPLITKGTAQADPNTQQDRKSVV